MASVSDTDRRAFLGRGAIGAAAAAFAMGRPGSAFAATEPAPAFVDVREFGAIGDGTVDDTAAIQAAIDTLRSQERPGGCVLFPAGTYLVSASIVVDYGITLRGVNPAASTIRMHPAVLADLVVGGPSFPVYVHLVDLTLDGGFDPRARDAVPEGSGAVNVTFANGVGGSVDRITATGADLAVGDVLRTSGQPVLVVSGVDQEVGATGDRQVFVCDWIAAEAPHRTSQWTVFGRGDLVRDCGRLTVTNCRLVRAKRHAISLTDATQGSISGCEIGENQGAAVFATATTDLTLSSTWAYSNGGPDVFLSESVDVRIGSCLFEGSGSSSIHAEWGEVELHHCGLWGGRVGLVTAKRSGTVRLDGLKLREPGYGDGTPAVVSSAGFAGVAGRPAISVHFADERFGAIVSTCSLHDAVDGTGPIVQVRNGSRSNVSAIEWVPWIRFAGGQTGRGVVEDDGSATIVRGVRGVGDAG